MIEFCLEARLRSLPQAFLFIYIFLKKFASIYNILPKTKPRTSSHQLAWNYQAHNMEMEYIQNSFHNAPSTVNYPQHAGLMC